MPKQARINSIKSCWCYTPKEAANCVGVSVRTTHNWIKEGLPVLASEHPVLIRGDDLRRFLQARRQDKKIKLGLCEFYCVSCRGNRKAALGLADLHITGNRAKMTALCTACETVVSKPVACATIPQIRRTLDLTIKRDDATL